MRITLDEFKKRIEFSLCQQFATEEDVREFCKKAVTTGVGVACVNPVNVALAAQLLGGDDIEISGNIGFPFGSHPTEVKALETEIAVEDGATQIDMVMNIGALKSGRDDLVQSDIEAVVRCAEGRVVKVIIEAWVLNNEEKQRASRIVERAGAQLVKTSTGVRTQYLKMVNPDPRGAVVDDILLIREVVSDQIRVKASGGIYSLDDTIAFLRAGADQLGVSKGAELIKEFGQRFPDGILI
ncbi:MAG: deoxyribose-phosphate aldolase [Anaerolineales bacterium]|nr:deoxyribose-phosphate aldolase [Anaerolineales bacterium]